MGWRIPTHGFCHEEALEEEEAQKAFCLLTLLANREERVALRFWLGRKYMSGSANAPEQWTTVFSLCWSASIRNGRSNACPVDFFGAKYLPIGIQEVVIVVELAIRHRQTIDALFDHESKPFIHFGGRHQMRVVPRVDGHQIQWALRMLRNQNYLLDLPCVSPLNPNP